MMPIVIRTRTVVTALICLSVLALGACSDDDPEPKLAPREPSTSAPTKATEPTSSPSDPVEPSMPGKAMKASDAGAEAFVRYFIDVLNFAQRTGDTTTLVKISTTTCAACSGYVKAIDKAYGSGGRVEGGQIQVGRLRELPKDYGADWGGYGQGRASSQVIYRGDGSQRSYQGGEFPLYVYPKWVDRGWAMQWMRTPA